MQQLAPMLFVAVAVVYSVGVPLASIRRSPRQIQKWAAQRRLHVLELRYVLIGGPFFGLGGQGNTYRITVENHCGFRRTGYIFVGWPLTIYMDDIQVKWDKPGSDAAKRSAPKQKR